MQRSAAVSARVLITVGCCFSDEILSIKEMEPDEYRYMSRNEPQPAIAVNSLLRFEGLGPGGLRLALMHNLTYFNYYIIIVIKKEEIILRYAVHITPLSIINVHSRVAWSIFSRTLQLHGKVRLLS